MNHHEQHPDGGMSGRDPRKMSAADLEACGLAKQSRGDAIRAHCTDCCVGNTAEIRRCALHTCPLWPFRMGTDPWRTPMSDERRQALSERFAATRTAAHTET